MKKFNLIRVGVPSAALILGSSAHAAPVDVTALVADIAAQVAPIALVGGAVLLVMIAVKAFRWIRAAMA